MAMPTVNSVGAVVASATAITPAPGAGHTANDIDILIIEDGAGTAITLATPNGFAELTAVSPQTTGAAGTGTTLSVFWRRWNGTDGSPVTGAPNNHAIGRMISISGCKTTGDPWNTTNTGATDAAADQTVSINGGTTSVANCLVLAMVAQSLPDALSTTEFSSWANAALASVTEQIDNSTAVVNGGAIGLATGEKATAGIFGATTAAAVTSSTRVCAMIALEGVSTGTTHDEVGSSSVVVSTTATGKHIGVRTGTSSVVVSASATGKRTAKGQGSSGVVVTTTATGKPTHKGIGSSNVVVTTSGFGNVEGVNQGAGTSSIVVSTTATGQRTAQGIGACSVTVGASATGKRRAHRTGSSSVVVTCTATGSAGSRLGQGSALLVVTATGTGARFGRLGWPVSTTTFWPVSTLEN